MSPVERCWFLSLLRSVHLARTGSLFLCRRLLCRLPHRAVPATQSRRDRPARSKATPITAQQHPISSIMFNGTFIA